MIWKQYLRLIPAYLGWFNKGAFLYQIDAILPSDIFIVSFPKSGNTWLRFIIASFFHPPEKINNRSIDTFVPDVYRNKKAINAIKKNRLIKTHNAWFEYHPKSIYIIRDYRDVIVSFFYYTQQGTSADLQLDDFLQSDVLKAPFGTWAQHAQRALEWKQKYPEKIIIVRYEDLLDRKKEVIEELFQFCQGERALAAEQVYDLFSYVQLKKDEEKHGNYYTDHTHQSFYRKGEKGDWKNQLNESQLQTILSDSLTKEMLAKFNYL
ncbi:MAG: sulfotransferase [Cytophagaceae bacterium]|jgi:hypothetical protein|nr:sulfotransferase [Cytophagaceae bacterium]